MLTNPLERDLMAAVAALDSASLLALALGYRETLDDLGATAGWEMTTVTTEVISLLVCEIERRRGAPDDPRAAVAALRGALSGVSERTLAALLASLEHGCPAGLLGYHKAMLALVLNEAQWRKVRLN